MKSLFIIFLAMTLLFVGLALAKPYEIEIKAKTLALPMPQGVAREVVERELLVTAYSSIDSCHNPDKQGRCIMASGKAAYIGAVACPRNIPLGTKLNILGDKYTCEDRYAKRLSERIDIWNGYGEEAHRAALIWGKIELPISYDK